MSAEIPEIQLLEPFAPSNIGTGAEELEYDNLLPNTHKYRLTHALRMSRAFETEPGSLSELHAVRQAALEGFLNTSIRLLATPELGDRDLWATRFNEASEELYGFPDRTEVSKLLFEELYLLDRLEGLDNYDQEMVGFIKSIYGEILGNEGDVELVIKGEEQKTKEAIADFGDVLLRRYDYAFELLDESELEEFHPNDLLELFGNVRQRLEEREGGDWHNWHVLPDETGAGLRVEPADKEILVGMRRVPATRLEARALLAHEILIHALRGKNGYDSGIEDMGIGLTDYLDAEEGLGLLAEYAVTGHMPDKAYDRYVDIAMAVGCVDGRQFNRNELFDVSYARQALRLQLAGKFDDDSAGELRQKVQVHIDRIFRGTAGDTEGSVYGVFTKDIVYYVGFRKMADFITEQKNKGMSMDSIFDYITAGKFDPTNSLHVQYLADNGLAVHN